LRISKPHFFGNFFGRLDLDQRPFVHARTAKRGLVPGLRARDDLGPKREYTALYWFDGMDRTPALPMKKTLTVRRFAKSQGARIPMNVFRFKINGIDGNMLRDADEILLREVNLAFHLAASRTAGLALETEACRIVRYFASNRLTPVVTIRSFFSRPGSGLLT
jgi:hypothetical protein